MITRSKKGFSLIEVMLLFTVLAVFMAATLPSLTRKSRPIPKRAPHGVYRCINDNGVLREYLFSSSKAIYGPNGRVVQQCTFNVPTAAMYKVDLYSAGAGGTKYAKIHTAQDDNRYANYNMSGMDLTSYRNDNSAGEVEPLRQPEDEELSIFEDLKVIMTTHTGNAGAGGTATVSYLAANGSQCSAYNKLYNAVYKQFNKYSDLCAKAQTRYNNEQSKKNTAVSKINAANTKINGKQNYDYWDNETYDSQCNNNRSCCSTCNSYKSSADSYTKKYEQAKTEYENCQAAEANCTDAQKRTLSNNMNSYKSNADYYTRLANTYCAASKVNSCISSNRSSYYSYRNVSISSQESIIEEQNEIWNDADKEQKLIQKNEYTDYACVGHTGAKSSYGSTYGGTCLSYDCIGNATSGTGSVSGADTYEAALAVKNWLEYGNLTDKAQQLYNSGSMFDPDRKYGDVTGFVDHQFLDFCEAHFPAMNDKSYTTSQGSTVSQGGKAGQGKYMRLTFPIRYVPNALNGRTRAQYLKNLITPGHPEGYYEMTCKQIDANGFGTKDNCTVGNTVRNGENGRSVTADFQSGLRRSITYDAAGTKQAFVACPTGNVVCDAKCTNTKDTCEKAKDPELRRSVRQYLKVQDPELFFADEAYNTLFEFNSAIVDMDLNAEDSLSGLYSKSDTGMLLALKPEDEPGYRGGGGSGSSFDCSTVIHCPIMENLTKIENCDPLNGLSLRDTRCPESWYCTKCRSGYDLGTNGCSCIKRSTPTPLNYHCLKSPATDGSAALNAFKAQHPSCNTPVVPANYNDVHCGGCASGQKLSSDSCDCEPETIVTCDAIKYCKSGKTVASNGTCICQECEENFTLSNNKTACECKSPNSLKGNACVKPITGCVTDDDCPGEQECVNGVCISPVTTCSGNNASSCTHYNTGCMECRSGSCAVKQNWKLIHPDGSTYKHHACLCKNDNACPDGQKCIDGECKSVGCTTASDCKHPACQVCNNYECVLKDYWTIKSHNCYCTDDRACPSGQKCIEGECKSVECTTDSQCKYRECQLCNNYVCDTKDYWTIKNNRCYCTDDRACPSGQKCIEGECKSVDCTTDSECTYPACQVCNNYKCDTKDYWKIKNNKCYCTDDRACAAGEKCIDGECKVPGCEKDSDCTYTCQNCQNYACILKDNWEIKNKKCYCLNDDACPRGSKCINGECTAVQCITYDDCPEGSGKDCINYECICDATAILDAADDCVCGCGKHRKDNGKVTKCDDGCLSDLDCCNGEMCNLSTHKCETSCPSDKIKDKNGNCVCPAGRVEVNGICKCPENSEAGDNNDACECVNGYYESNPGAELIECKLIPSCGESHDLLPAKLELNDKYECVCPENTDYKGQSATNNLTDCCKNGYDGKQCCVNGYDEGKGACAATECPASKDGAPLEYDSVKCLCPDGSDKEGAEADQNTLCCYDGRIWIPKIKGCGCVQDTDCKDPAKPYCNKDSGECYAGCATDADCKDSKKPICDTTKHECGPCKTDKQCKAKDEDKPYCNTDSGECYAGCATDADCKDSKKPICDTTKHECVPCTSDKQCEDKDKDKPYCNTKSGECYGGCATSADCEDVKQPICDTTEHECVPCKTDKQCKEKDKDKPYCHTESGECKICLEDDNCPDGQICVDYKCSDGCRDDNGCPDGQICVDEKCQEGCRISKDCKYDCQVCSAEHKCELKENFMIDKNTNKCVCKDGFVLQDGECITPPVPSCLACQDLVDNECKTQEGFKIVKDGGKDSCTCALECEEYSETKNGEKVIPKCELKDGWAIINNKCYKKCASEYQQLDENGKCVCIPHGTIAEGDQCLCTDHDYYFNKGVCSACPTCAKTLDKGNECKCPEGSHPEKGVCVCDSADYILVDCKCQKKPDPGTIKRFDMNVYSTNGQDVIEYAAFHIPDINYHPNVGPLSTNEQIRTAIKKDKLATGGSAGWVNIEFGYGSYLDASTGEFVTPNPYVNGKLVLSTNYAHQASAQGGTAGKDTEFTNRTISGRLGNAVIDTTNSQMHQEPRLKLETKLWTKQFEIGRGGTPGKHEHFVTTNLGTQCEFVVPRGGEVLNLAANGEKHDIAEMESNLAVFMNCTNTRNEQVFSKRIEGGKYNLDLFTTAKYWWSKQKENQHSMVYGPSNPSGIELEPRWAPTSLWAKAYNLFMGGRDNYDLNRFRTTWAGSGTTLTDNCLQPRGTYRRYMVYVQNGSEGGALKDTGNVNEAKGLYGGEVQCYPAADGSSSGERILYDIDPLVQRGAYTFNATAGGGGAVVITW